MGNPEFGCDLQPIDFTRVAVGFGWKTLHVERQEDLAGVVAEAGALLVEAAVDPNEPLMPGKIKPEQAEHYAEALRRGTPNARRIGLTLFRDAVEDFTGRNRETIVTNLRKKAPELIEAPPARG